MLSSPAETSNAPRMEVGVRVRVRARVGVGARVRVRVRVRALLGCTWGKGG